MEASLHGINLYNMRNMEIYGTWFSYWHHSGSLALYFLEEAPYLWFNRSGLCRPRAVIITRVLCIHRSILCGMVFRQGADGRVLPICLLRDFLIINCNYFTFLCLIHDSSSAVPFLILTFSVIPFCNEWFDHVLGNLKYHACREVFKYQWLVLGSYMSRMHLLNQSHFGRGQLNIKFLQLFCVSGSLDYLLLNRNRRISPGCYQTQPVSYIIGKRDYSFRNVVSFRLFSFVSLFLISSSVLVVVLD